MTVAAPFQPSDLDGVTSGVSEAGLRGLGLVEVTLPPQEDIYAGMLSALALGQVLPASRAGARPGTSAWESLSLRSKSYTSNGFGPPDNTLCVCSKFKEQICMECPIPFQQIPSRFLGPLK